MRYFCNYCKIKLEENCHEQDPFWIDIVITKTVLKFYDMVSNALNG